MSHQILKGTDIKFFFDNDNDRASSQYFRNFIVLPVFLFFIVSLVIAGEKLSMDDEYKNESSSSSSIDKLPFDIETICSEDFLKTIFGKEQCLSLCDKPSCCSLPIENNLSCLQEMSSACGKIRDFCANASLYYSNEKETHNDTSSSSSSNGKTILTENDKIVLIREACTQELLSENNEVGVESCYNLCVERKCCFLNETQNGSCSNNLGLQAWCEEFSPCKVVFKLANKSNNLN